MNSMCPVRLDTISYTDSLESGFDEPNHSCPKCGISEDNGTFTQIIFDTPLCDECCEKKTVAAIEYIEHVADDFADTDKTKIANMCASFAKYDELDQHQKDLLVDQSRKLFSSWFKEAWLDTE